MMMKIENYSHHISRTSLASISNIRVCLALSYMKISLDPMPCIIVELYAGGSISKEQRHEIPDQSRSTDLCRQAHCQILPEQGVIFTGSLGSLFLVPCLVNW
ncbi:hypothetical protein IHQ56_09965 [Methylobacillus flagellatus]|nr:hypothetical protein [Methylobacillus flagellatus]